MRLTMLKVMALLSCIVELDFPWWMWLWGIVSEVNGLLYYSVTFGNNMKMLKIIDMSTKIAESAKVVEVTTAQKPEE